MMIGSYILFRVLVCDLLLNPSGLGLIPIEQTKDDKSSNIKINFKILASMSYYTIMEYME